MDPSSTPPKKKLKFQPPLKKCEEVMQTENLVSDSQNIADIKPQNIFLGVEETDRFSDIISSVYNGSLSYNAVQQFSNDQDDFAYFSQKQNEDDVESQVSDSIISPELEFQEDEFNSSPMNLFSSCVMSFGQKEYKTSDKESSFIEENEVLLEIGKIQNPNQEGEKDVVNDVSKDEVCKIGRPKEAKQPDGSQAKTDDKPKEKSSNKGAIWGAPSDKLQKPRGKTKKAKNDCSPVKENRKVEEIEKPKRIVKSKFPSADLDAPFTGNYKLATDVMKRRHEYCLRTGEYIQYENYRKLFCTEENSKGQLLMTYKNAAKLTRFTASVVKALKKEDLATAVSFLNNFKGVPVTAASQKYAPHFLYLTKLVRSCESYPNQLRHAMQEGYYSCQAMFGIPDGETFESVLVGIIKKEKIDQMFEIDALLESLLNGVDETFYVEDSFEEEF